MATGILLFQVAASLVSTVKVDLEDVLRFYVQLAPMAFAIVAVVTAPVLPVLVAVFRSARWVRGWVDGLFGGLLAGGAGGVLHAAEAELARVDLGVVAICAIAGGAGGVVYWLAAGRPRPPYHHLLPPGQAPQTPVST